jgi:outer membrane protein OmpA-like peptidoglycan-associated protein/tetratricopeptide (TPR) repeat protein
MNKRIFFFTFAIIAGIATSAFGQINKAKKQMTLYNYSEALSILNKSLKKDKTDKHEAALLIAECYFKQNDIQNAREWFEKVIEYGDPKPAALFNYAQVLRSWGDYQKAKKYFIKYDELFPGDCRAKILANYCDSAIVWKNIPPKIEVKNAVSLNSEQSEFGPVFFESRLCFTSDRMISKNNNNKYGWTGNSYLHLFYAEPIQIDDFYRDFKEIRLAPDLFNQAYHDGPASYNSGFTEVFYNRTIIYKDKGKKEQDHFRTHLLKIYSSERKGSKWTKPVPFFLNNDNYSVGHPALSRDGTILYFVSDMKGGYGGTDIYMCRRENNKWSKPVNLGPVINTFGNEMFPFLADNGDLYFASDGHPGFGGLDIFVTHQINDSTWVQPRNMNQPVNSSYDDFSLCISKNNMNGIFSSNRPGGLGNDDLYLFRRLPDVKILPNYYLSGYVKDKITLKPINNATVFFVDQDKNQALILKTDSNGYYRTQIEPGKPYIVKAMQPGYIADCYLFTPDTVSNIAEKNAPRDLLLDMLRNNRTFVLENIYYDLDRWNIRPDAQPALDKLVSIMKENPVKIELGSHTDSRASDAYNLVLSQKRAESAVRYIVLQGIDPDRITARGYGETQLVNKCKNGIPCTEVEHQKNRRTEFKVTSGFNEWKEEPFNLSNYKTGVIIDVRLLPDRFFEICK